MRARRHGFTLVELLVVIAIIAVLAALLIPAVQQARESARKTQCRNNLKQLGLALHNYNEAFQVFPPGWLWRTSTTIGSGGNGATWLVCLLPHIEQLPLYNQLNFNTALHDNQPNYEILKNTSIPTFNCPTFPRQSNKVIHRASWNPSEYIPLPNADYAGNAGSGIDSTGNPLLLDFGMAELSTWNGIFGWNSSIGLRDVTDGTSSTFLCGERWVDPWHMPDDWSVITDGAPLPAARHYMGGDVGIIGGQGMDTCRHAYWGPNTQSGCLFDYSPGVPSPLGTSGQGAITQADLDAVRCPSNSGTRHAFNFLPFGGFHQGVVNFAMCDGSVRAISDKIDSNHRRSSLGVFQRLATRNGGELASDY